MSGMWGLILSAFLMLLASCALLSLLLPHIPFPGYLDVAVCSHLDMLKVGPHWQAHTLDEIRRMKAHVAANLVHNRPGLPDVL